jgi:hypothetical protein
MAKISQTQLDNALRADFMGKLTAWLIAEDEDVGFTASNVINMPCVDSEGNEKWLKITVTVPKGANKGTEPYDGYGERESYDIKLSDKADKKAKAEAKKAEKIAKDKLRRENEAKIKAKNEGVKG